MTMELMQYRKQYLYACVLICAALTMFGYFSINVDYRAQNFRPYMKTKTKLEPRYKIKFTTRKIPSSLSMPLSSETISQTIDDQSITEQVTPNFASSAFSAEQNTALESLENTQTTMRGINAETTVFTPIRDSESRSRDMSARYSETSATFNSDAFGNLNLADVTNKISQKQNESTEDDRSILHLSRIKLIRDMCQTPSVFKESAYSGRNATKYYYSDQYDFAYCKVPKCGSTFWTQAFNVLKHGTEDADAVLNAKRSQVHSGMGEYTTSFSLVQRYETPTILASRDPYSRLYSAFVDKVYLPNMFKTCYSIAGIQDINSDQLKCPGNSSFDDFLMFIVNKTLQGQTLNRHWAPIVSLCRPCDIKPVILLKQETFATDVQYILENFKVDTDKREVLMNALKNNRVQCTIPGIVQTVIGRTSERSLPYKCLGPYEIAYRLWRSFQIQGYLKSSVKFPDITDTSHLRNATYISELIINAIDNNPMSRDETKQQRQQFLEDAYKTVKAETIKGIQSVFSSDFLIYDYDPEPPVRYDSKK